METINIKDVKLGVIGCGKMAGAILGGVIKNGFLDNKNIFVFDVNSSASEKLGNDFGFSVCSSIEELLKKTNTILISVKPFVVCDVMNEVKKYYSNHLILSILAGVKIEKYISYIPDAQIVRIMPNTPALVNEGASAICPCKNIEEFNLQFAFEFMKNCGKVVLSTEDKMDIITALSGSGPAYYFRIIDLMAKSAQKLGLDYEQAILLSAQTALGSAKMLIENNFDVEQLIKNVTTPKGCTEVGNNVLNDSNIDVILDKTIKDTMLRAKELG